MLFVVPELWKTSAFAGDFQRISVPGADTSFGSKMFWNSGFFVTFVSAQIEMVPQNYQPLSEEQGVQMQKLIDAMEDDDDVQNVWHNWEE